MFDNVRRVSRQLFAYGTADVLVLLVNFLLLPLYTRVLTPREYGALALLLLAEAFLKVVNRWGLDHGLLRFYYDQPTGEERRTLATTVAVFIGCANGLLALALVAAAPAINSALFGSQEFVTPYRWLVLNNFVGGFLFLPLTQLRVQERARLYASITFLRSFGTVLLRLVFVIALRMGVLGLVLADVVVTATLLVLLAGTFRRMLGSRFSVPLLKELLAYGLPHIPHGLLSQTMSMVDRFVMGVYLPLQQVGLYLIALTIGSVVKYFPVAFEAAWMPFAFDSLRRQDAAALYARMATYAFAVLALSTVAIAALAPPAIALLLPENYREATPLVPLLTLGLAVQSLAWFPMTSVNVAKQTRVYPLVTAIGAGVSVGANLLLVPRFGMDGAAWALLISQTIATAATTFFAQRVYRIPYETARMLKVAAVGLLTYAAMLIVPGPSAAWTIAARVLLLGLFPVALLAVGFVEPREWSELRRLLARLRGDTTTPASAATAAGPLTPRD